MACVQTPTEIPYSRAHLDLLAYMYRNIAYVLGFLLLDCRYVLDYVDLIIPSKHKSGRES